MLPFAGSVALSLLWSRHYRSEEAEKKKAAPLPSPIPIAVNYHFTRKCNFNCGFCFHTDKNSHVETLDSCKSIIRQLREAGAEKINFAGGEPFLPEYNKILGEMVKYAKQECKYSSVSIISNGYFIKRDFFEKYAQYLDILGVSCDSDVQETNVKIGRGRPNQQHTQRERVISAAILCKEFNVKFKLNTVVNAHNKLEDMSSLINEAKPMRWKIFQVLPLDGENTGQSALRDVSSFLITENEFSEYVRRHKHAVFDSSIMKIEDNSTMQSSYVLVDEFGRFLDSSTGGKIPTKSILEVGVEAALAELASSDGGGFDEASFRKREGVYREQWSKESPSTSKGVHVSKVKVYKSATQSPRPRPIAYSSCHSYQSVDVEDIAVDERVKYPHIIY